jgi:predicted nucleotidyltransferase
LGTLADVGLVSVSRTVAADGYRLNDDHYLADQIADLFRTESRAAEELEGFIRRLLLDLTDKIEWATLFGSVVDRASTSMSDVDLAIQCSPEDLAEVEEALEDLSLAVKRRFGNQVDPLVTVRKRRPKTGVWSRLESEGLPLIRSGKAA